MPAKAEKSRSTVRCIYIIVGKDRFLVGAECARLLDELIEPEQRAMGLFDADPEKVTITEVLDELRTISFFAQKRVVVVKNADEFVSDNRERLEKYFDNPSTSGVLVMTLSTWPRNTKLAKKLSSAGELITVKELKAWQLPQYAITYAREKHAKVLAKEAASLLVELAGDEPGKLCSEIDKLAVFAEDQKSITANHVEALVGHNRLFDAFAVINAITAGDSVTAVQRLRRMFASDKDAGYSIVGAFAYHFRRMFGAAALLEKRVSVSQAARQLGIWRDEEAFFALVRKMGLERVASVLQELARIDYEIKTGQVTAEVAMERLIMRLSD